MTINQAASTYAKAIFRAVMSSTNSSIASLEQKLQELNEFLHLINSNSNLKFVLYAPVIGFSGKNKLIRNLEKKLNISVVVTNLLLTLAKNQRFNLLELVIAKFSDLIKNDKAIVEAEIISAKELSTTEFAATKIMLADKYAKNFIFIRTIDPNLLGGLVVKFDNKILDASISGALKKFNIKSRELISVL